MPIEHKNSTVWSIRLKTAREASGMSQRTLGIAAGLDPSVASTRINRYEVGVHAPAYPIALKLAVALNVPVAYLYCDDEALSRVILRFHNADARGRQKIERALDS